MGKSYEGRELAGNYVKRRFQNQLMKLLHDKQVKVVNHCIKKYSPEHAIEIAPGPGRITREIENFKQLTCLEYNEGMIDEGKLHTPKAIRWIHGNAFDLPFEDSEFDLAYSFRFIRHFQIADRIRLYSEIRRVLKMNSICVFDAVNSKISKPLRDASPGGYPVYDKLYVEESELIDELKDAGFEVIDITPALKWFSFQHRIQSLISPRSVKLSSTLIRLAEVVSSKPSLEWIVTCRKV